jgi:archaellum biogenesis ATPase FlaH
LEKLKHLIKKTKGEKKWLIENLIPLGEIVMLYGKSDIGKTSMAIKIASEIATGSMDLGKSVIGKTYIFAQETLLEDYVLRIRGLVNMNYPNQKEDIFENLNLNFDNDLVLTEDTYGTYVTYRDPKKPRPWRFVGGAFPYSTHSETPSLIIIDTLSQSIANHSVNEDAAIRKVIRNCKAWIQGAEYNISIIIIAHSGQNESRGVMGSSIQNNDFPTVLKIRKKKNDQLELYREKFKGRAKKTGIPFKIRDTLVDSAETVYVDMGKSLGEFENQIVTFFESGLSKKEIKDNIYELGIHNTSTRNSFSVVYNRHWKNLISMGFITDKQQDNNN